MLTPEVVVPTEQTIRAALGNCLRILGMVDTLLELNANRKTLEEQLARFYSTRFDLNNLLRASGQFGTEFLADLNHDLAASPSEASAGIYGGIDNYPACRTLLKGIRYILGSIDQEFVVKFEPVNVTKLVTEVIKYSEAGFQISSGVGYPRIKFILDVNPEAVVAKSQTDILFRIFDNLARNSAKELGLGDDEPKPRKKTPIGEIRFPISQTGTKIKLDIIDNGDGLSRYFKSFGLIVEDKTIPLSEVLKQREKATESLRINHGSGRGWRVCQRLASMIGAEIYIANPSLVQGTSISVVLPAA